MCVWKPEGESLRRAAGHVEQELGVAPPAELLGVNVERNPGHFSQEHVARTGREIVCEQAQRKRAVAASPRLEQRERAMCETSRLSIVVAWAVALKETVCWLLSI